MLGCRNWEMRVVAAAGAALVFTTRSNFICRSQFWHFHSNVPRGIFVVTFLVMICDALYGCSATCWIVPQLAPQFCTCPVLFCRSNFVQFCTNFRLAAFLHKSIFLRTRLHISARGAHRRLNAPQWTGVHRSRRCTLWCASCSSALCACTWHCDFNVNNPVRICANDCAP